MTALRARLAVRVDPGDVGRRVTVRSRTHAAPGQPRYTDMVGVLRAWEEGELVIERRDGTLGRVREADLVAARVLPAPPPSRR